MDLVIKVAEISVLEKGNATKILEWFKDHRDDEYAKVLEKVVKESRKKLTLR